MRSLPGFRRLAAMPRRAVALAALGAALVLPAGVFGFASFTSAAAADCTIAWDGGAGTINWHDAANWVGDRLPGADDHVCIPEDAPGRSVLFFGAGTTTVASIQSEKLLNPAAGHLVVAGESTVAELSLAGGVFEPNGLTVSGEMRQGGGELRSARSVNVQGAFVWSGGTQSGNGSLIADGTGGVRLEGDRTRTIRGPWLVSSGTDVLWTGDGEIAFENGGGLQALRHLRFDGGAARATGAGTVHVTQDVFVDRGALRIDAALEMNGTAHVESAGAQLALGKGGESFADLKLANGGSVFLDGPGHLFQGRIDAAVGGGVVAHTDVVVAEPFTAGFVQVNSGGSLKVAAGTKLGRVTMSGTILELPGDVEATSFEHTRGVVRGAGSLTVTGDYTWRTGTMSGTGATVLQDGRLKLAGTQVRMLARRLDAPHGLDWTDGGELDVAGGAELEVDGTSELTANARLTGAGRVAVAGIFRIEGVDLDAEARIETTASNANIEVTDGATLHLSAPSTQRGWTTLADRTSFLTLSNGRQVFEAGSSIVGDGVVTVSDTADVVFRGTAKPRFLSFQGGASRVEAPAEVEEVIVRGDVTVAPNASIKATQEIWLASDDTILEAPTSVLQAPIVKLTPDDDPVLRGTGTVRGTLDNGGTVQPDGTFKVEGDYVQREPGYLWMDFTRAAGAPLLDVTGAAALGGGHLEVSLPSASGTERALVRAASRTGEFFVNTLPQCSEVAYTATGASIVAKPCVTLTGPGEVAEDAGNATFMIRLSPVSTQTVTVSYTTEDGSATAGTDYTATTGTATFAPGTNTRSVNVPLVDDDTQEEDERFAFRLTGATNASVETTEPRFAEINDDDGGPAGDRKYKPVDMGRLGLRMQPKAMNHRSVVGWTPLSEWPLPDTRISFGYRFDLGQLSNIAPLGTAFDVNSAGDVVGNTDQNDEIDYKAVVRKNGPVVVELPPVPGHRSVYAYGINDLGWVTGEAMSDGTGTVAALYRPQSGWEVISSAEGWNIAFDVNDKGQAIGYTHGGGVRTAWLWDNGTMRTITAAGTLTTPRRLNEKGIVVGITGEPGQSGGRAFVWNPAVGAVDLGPGMANDINERNEIVGWADGMGAALWTPDGELHNLNDLIPAGTGWTLTEANAINDNGVIAGWGYRNGARAAFVLKPLDCEVCVDEVKTEQLAYSTSTWTETDKTVDGNEVRITATIKNEGFEPKDVVATVVDKETGEQLGEEIEPFTLAPDASHTITADWNTAGAAWENGEPRRERTIKIVLREADETPQDEHEQPLKIAPRPVLFVHGLWSDASTWAAYPGFLQQVNPDWFGQAVSTMDTSSAIPNTIAQNAGKLGEEIEAVRRSQEAQHVDLVAHSMGGLISRYYVQALMQSGETGPAVKNLVMIGTPNWGSPCAWLLPIPAVVELRPEIVAAFNGAVTDRRGVNMSVAAGMHMPVTCGAPLPGDDVVPLVSAQTGWQDTQVFDIAHTSMTGSRAIFDQFVKPRLSAGGQAGLNARRASTAAADGEPELGDRNPQLAASDTPTIPPGEAETFFLDTSGASAVGAALAAPGTVEAVLFDSFGEEVATLPRDPGLGRMAFRTLRSESVDGGEWVLSVANRGDEPVTVPVSVWLEGTQRRLVANAFQSNASGTIRVEAQLVGVPTGQGSVFARIARAGADPVQLELFDDGLHGDQGEGDGIWSNRTAALPNGNYAVRVSANVGSFSRVTTAAALVTRDDTPPPNRAPVPTTEDFEVESESNVQVRLTATDADDDDLTYELLGTPDRGTLTGTPPLLTYRSPNGFVGTDQFRYRVSDGTVWSGAHTVTITVTKRQATIFEDTVNEAREATTIQLRGKLVDAGRGTVIGGNLEIDVEGETIPVTASSIDGVFGTEYEVGPGERTLTITMRFLGSTRHAPTQLTFEVPVRSNRGPTVVANPWFGGEAGYATRFFHSASDADSNLTKVEWDWQDDGTYDLVDELADGPDEAHEFVYPAAFTGQARVRVTDALGSTAEDTIDVSIAPHRPLGNLRRITVDGRRIKMPNLTQSTSEDGRFVLFDRPRNDYGPTGQPDELFVLDRQTGQDERVGVLPNGDVLRAHGLYETARISPDGRWVAFNAPSGPTNSIVYLRDRAAKTNESVSVSSSEQAANGHTRAIQITPGGRYVLLQSRATNLDPRTAQCGSNCFNLYVRDRETGTTELASVTHDNKPSQTDSLSGGISADGRYVVFATGFKAVPEKTTSVQDVFVRDLATDTTTRVSLPAGGGEANGNSSVASISDRGRYVMFSSLATNLVGGDTNGKEDLYRVDRDSDGDGVFDEPGATAVERMSVATGGAESNDFSSFATTNCDGSVVAFYSRASNLVAGDTNDNVDHFVRDLARGTTTRISVDGRDGREANHEAVLWPIVSADGRYVLFESDANNLVPGDTNGLRDVFVLDRGEAAAVDCWNGGGTPANSAPVAQPRTAETDEDTAVEVELTATDVDGDALSYAVATAPQHGTLTGTGSTRTYTPEPGFHGTDTFAFTASDGQLTSAPATVTITVLEANEPPVAEDDAFSLDEDETFVPLVPGVLANDTDADEDLLTALPAAQPEHGDVLLLEDGSFAYTPDPDFHGTDTFTYRASDGTDESEPATVTLTVDPVNDAPVCPALAFELDEDAPLERTLGCEDVDGETLAYELADGAEHGEVTLAADGSFRYVPEAEWSGEDGFSVHVSDGEAEVELEVALTVRAVDDPAVLAADAYATDEDRALEVGENEGVLANDRDPDTELAATLVSGPEHGTLELDGDGSFRYVPAPQFHGEDGFRYAAGGAEAAARIVVRSQNDGPRCEDASLTTAEDEAGTVRIACTDPDGSGLAVTLGQPGHGSTTNDGLNVTYTPAANYHGADEVPFTVRDAGGKEATGRIAVTVTAVNDLPVARPDTAATDEDETLSLPVAALLGNDADVDGDELRVVSVGQAEHGTVELDGDRVRFVPAANYHGPAGFRATIGDGHGGTDAADVQVSVRSVNDRPTADDVAAATDEDTAVAATLVGADVDGEELAFRIVDGPSHGTLAGQGAERTYNPAPNWHGTDTLTYVARDGSVDSAPATVRIQVRPVNDAPVARPDEAAMDEDESVRIDAARLLANDDDVDGDRLRVAGVAATDATHGEVSVVDGDVRYAPAGNWNGTASFRVTVADGNGGEDTSVVTVTVRPVNDAPTVTLAPAGPVDEGGAKAEVKAAAADVDGDQLTYTWETDAGTIHGGGASVELSADDGPKAAHVTVRVSDGTRAVEDRQTVEIRNVAPGVNAGGAVTGHWGVPLSFAGSVSDPSEADRAAGLQPRWQFGGGGSAEGVNARHTFDVPGSYDARLTATDKDGGTGSATATATVTRRPVELRLDATSGPFGLAGVTARLVDTVDPDTARLGGRTIVLRVDGKDVAVETDATGRARLPLATPLVPGTHEVSATFAEDSHYLGAQAGAVSLTVAITNGKVTAGVTLAAGKATFNPQANNRRLRGLLEWTPTGGATFRSAEFTALGIADDQRSAWFAGIGKDGRAFVAYVEDNGEPGKPDVFRLWIDGTLVTGDGEITGGNLQLHRFDPSSPAATQSSED